MFSRLKFRASKAGRIVGRLTEMIGASLGAGSCFRHQKLHQGSLCALIRLEKTGFATKTMAESIREDSGASDLHCQWSKSKIGLCEESRTSRGPAKSGSGLG